LQKNERIPGIFLARAHHHFLARVSRRVRSHEKMRGRGARFAKRAREAKESVSFFPVVLKEDNKCEAPEAKPQKENVHHS
jgi:hypothetical protein